MAESVHSVGAAIVTGQGRADGHPSIFISRAGADSEVAGIFGEILEAAGYPVVLQQWDFGSGSFIEHMHAGLANDSLVLAVLSQSYLASPYCAAEWQAALAPDPLNRKGRLVLLRIDDCVPDGSLGANDLLGCRSFAWGSDRLAGTCAGSARSTRAQSLHRLADGSLSGSGDASKS